MKVIRNFVPDELIRDEILNNPQVAGYYEVLTLFGQSPSHSEQPILFRLLNGAYPDFDFQLKEGRMIEAPDEAMVGFAVMDMLGIQIGDTANFIIEGTPTVFRIVGRYFESSNIGFVVLSRLETYQEQLGMEVQPSVYYLRLQDFNEADTWRQEWLEESQSLLTINIIKKDPPTSTV